MHLKLEEYGTDREKFVNLMMQLKETDPNAYDVMMQQCRALAGTIKLSARERADLIARYRALAPENAKVQHHADELERQLARKAGS